MSFTVIIPARYASSRLPRKPLLDIAGKPMIQHVWEKAQQAGANRVIIATDHPEIEAVAHAFGAEVCMTSTAHNSGTERLAEVIEKMAIADNEIIVNVQGDEPLIPPVIVAQVAENLDKHQVNMATLVVKLNTKEELFNPNAVKTLTDQHGFALYSRVRPFHLHAIILRIVTMLLLRVKTTFAILAFMPTAQVL